MQIRRSPLAAPPAAITPNSAPASALPQATPAPLDLVLAPSGKQGQHAADVAMRALQQHFGTRADPNAGFAARTIETDELGMTHVRFDRTFAGLKVFPEQVMVHLSSDGSVASVTGELREIPKRLALVAPALTAQQATRAALHAFGSTTDSPPTAEQVVTLGDDGQYHVAYHVECVSLGAPSGPRKQNYLIDANSGAVLDDWNQLGTMFAPRPASAARLLADPPPLRTTSGSAAPNLAIDDNSKIESSIHLDGDYPVGQLQLDLDISHTYVSDLEVYLVSPTGKRALVWMHAGNNGHDLKQSFDLSKLMGRQPVAGDWKLTVEDTGNGDTGTLNRWSISVTEKDPTPPPPPPPPDDTSLYAGLVGLGATRGADGSYTLDDDTRGNGVETRDAMNQDSGAIARSFHDDNNTWGEATDDRRTVAAIDAQYGAEMTYDFYEAILGRSSIDGWGERLVSNVHLGYSYVNAFWDGSQMNYGDGDGRQAGTLTTLDVAGHEITHGLTQRTAGLIYRGESGGLNEAMSDIVGGAGVEWYALQHNPQLEGKVDPYLCAEQCWTPDTPGDALRYMGDPSRDRYSIDNYSQFRGSDQEVHRTSGIANNAFYLLTHGGTNRTSGVEVKDAIGMEKGLRIFGRALVHYMTQDCTFSGARQACITAATDLYGADSVEVAKVKAAWGAVGVW